MSQFTDTIQQIREAGTNNARITNMAGTQNVKIEINKNGQWVTIMRDLKQSIAEDILRQANNRLILG